MERNNNIKGIKRAMNKSQKINRICRALDTMSFIVIASFVVGFITICFTSRNDFGEVHFSNLQFGLLLGLILAFVLCKISLHICIRLLAKAEEKENKEIMSHIMGGMGKSELKEGDKGSFKVSEDETVKFEVLSEDKVKELLGELGENDKEGDDINE